MIYNSIITKNRQYLRPQINGKTNFMIFQQNIRGITHKTEELSFSLSEINPQVFCIAETHLRPEEINLINLGQYTLGAQYSRWHFRQGGVSIFTLNNIVFDVIDLNQFCREKDFEICALKIQLMSTYLLVLCIYRSTDLEIYRSPSGDFSYFLTQLEIVLNKLYKISVNIILCGDFNVNFSDSTSRAPVLESLLHSFYLESIVEFPTSFMPTSQTIIYNIFLDKKTLKSQVYPHINGISDHDAQLIILLDLTYYFSKSPSLCRRVIDDYSVQKFIELLSHESWEVCIFK